MTPDEKTISDTMHDKLEVVDTGQVQQSLLGRTSDGAPIVVCLCADRLFIGCGSSVIGLDAKAFQKLEQFAQSIGWRCD